MGISFGDYDGDGFDVVTGWTGIWRNVGGTGCSSRQTSPRCRAEAPAGFILVSYDNDGPRHRRLAPSAPAWETIDVASQHFSGKRASSTSAPRRRRRPAQPYGNDETLCWADVNGDGNLDLFTGQTEQPRNFPFERGGPRGGGAYRFVGSSEAWSRQPQWTLRPEGAQFCDVEGDGDVDLYSNGALYQNVSTDAAARFGRSPRRLRNRA
jgi:hypothetical protein